jgi:hypothetical protein
MNARATLSNGRDSKKKIEPERCVYSFLGSLCIHDKIESRLKTYGSWTMNSTYDH